MLFKTDENIPLEAVDLTYHPADYPGLFVLRLARQSTPEVVRVLRRMLEVLKTADCHGQLWIVEHDRIRVRS